MIEVCALPWLHIKIGVVNHIVTTLLKAVPKAKAWPDSLHLRQEQYHGNGYEGNECQKLLNNLDQLEDVLNSLDKDECAYGRQFLFVFKNLNK